MQSIGIHTTRTLSARSGPSQAVAAFLSLLFILLFGHPQTADAQATHDHADIQAAAEAGARSVNATPNGRIDVVASQIDARVRMPACDRPLETSIPYGNKSAARVTVEVRCTSPKPWKIYVPVRAAIFREVAVAARPLTRGSILAPDDIILTEVDTSQLPRGYIVSIKHAVGHKLRRAMNSGDPLTPALLETPAIIRRGQRVSLEARSGALTVRMVGIAQSNGILGEVIEFENQSSKRPVQAIVRSPQHAEILIR